MTRKIRSLIRIRGVDLAYDTQMHREEILFSRRLHCYGVEDGFSKHTRIDPTLS